MGEVLNKNIRECNSRPLSPTNGSLEEKVVYTAILAPLPCDMYFFIFQPLFNNCGVGGVLLALFSPFF